MNQIRLGLPKGSLNTIGRGNTHELFVDAGYEIKDYEPGKESKRIIIVNDPEIIAFLARPQSAPVELDLGMLDAAIIGEDWVREETINQNGVDIKKVGDLEYGQTRLVVAVPNDKPFESLTDFFRAQKERMEPIKIFTEYVNLTQQHVMQNEGYKQIFGNARPIVRIRGLRDGENGLVRIVNSDGVTEGYIEKGADLIVDNTQSGETLKGYGLRELEEIMKSSTGLYTGPSCTGWKEKKARDIFEQLYGAIAGRKYFDVKFNVPNTQLEGVRRYLISQRLCAAEPTVTKGENFSQINILIPKEKFPEALRTIKAEYDARDVVRNAVKQYVR